MKIKKYPFDFNCRKFDVVVVLRETQKEPETLEDYFEAMNLKSFYIQSLAFFLTSIDTKAFEEINPTNLQTYLENLGFLMMCFADDMTVEESILDRLLGLADKKAR